MLSHTIGAGAPGPTDCAPTPKLPLSSPPPGPCRAAYSQATSSGGAIFMAGQIPLDPGSMTVAPGGFAAQARLALANTQAVAVAAGGCLGSACLGLTVYLAAAAAGPGARSEVQGLLRLLQTDPAGFAARDARLRLRRAGILGPAPPAAAAPAGHAAAGAEEEEEEEFEAGAGGEGTGSDEEGEGFLDDYLRPPRTALRLRPAVLYVEVPALPRG
jgi:enamine deaminase RidA (YjgF/YER057c/UK114 family)